MHLCLLLCIFTKMLFKQTKFVCFLIPKLYIIFVVFQSFLLTHDSSSGTSTYLVTLTNVCEMRILCLFEGQRGAQIARLLDAAMEDSFAIALHLHRFQDLFCGSHATSYQVESYMVLKVSHQESRIQTIFNMIALYKDLKSRELKNYFQYILRDINLTTKDYLSFGNLTLIIKTSDVMNMT